MDRSAANRQGNVMELSGNFTLSGEWSPFSYDCSVIANSLLMSDVYLTSCISVYVYVLIGGQTAELIRA